jgi:hypothetical protein
MADGTALYGGRLMEEKMHKVVLRKGSWAVSGKEVSVDW